LETILTDEYSRYEETVVGVSKLSVLSEFFLFPPPIQTYKV